MGRKSNAQLAAEAAAQAAVDSPAEDTVMSEELQQEQREAAEAAAQEPVLEFEVLTNRMFGYQIGDTFRCTESEFQPQWAQHLKQI